MLKGKEPLSRRARISGLKVGGKKGFGYEKARKSYTL